MNYLQHYFGYHSKTNLLVLGLWLGLEWSWSQPLGTLNNLASTLNALMLFS